nr:MAG TPA: hypothetical protein [Caudoviricetes sp.]
MQRHNQAISGSGSVMPYFRHCVVMYSCYWLIAR